MDTIPSKYVLWKGSWENIWESTGEKKNEKT